MIRIVIEFRSASADAVTAPYSEEIVGSSYEQQQDCLVIFGVFKGEGTVVISLVNVNSFTVYDLESNRPAEKYNRLCDFPEIIFQRQVDRRRLNVKFRTPSIPGQFAIIGELTDHIPRIGKIINISGMIVCKDGETLTSILTPESSFALDHSNGKLLMRVDREELCDCPVHILIEYESN